MKVYQVFESYPLFYQPYIPPVIKALDDVEGVKITIVAFKGEKRKGSDYKLVMIPGYRKRILYKKIYQFFNKEFRNLDYFEIRALKDKVDIIHIQHSYLFPKVINLLKLDKSKRPKIIITLRGGDTYIKPWIGEKWRNFYRDYGNKVDAFVVMSEDQKKYLSVKWGVDKEIIHVIPISYGIKSEVKPKYPNSKLMRIISAFRMCWEKNIDGNLQIVKRLKTMGVPVQYEVYGGGQDAGQLYYLIDKYNLSDCVSYKGRIQNEDLKSILPEFDYFLQLSHSESLGISVVEAQAYGVPAIVSNSDGLPESVIDGETSYCINPDDIEKGAERMLHLWKDRELYKEFSANAIAFANSKFTVSAEVSKLQNLYTTLSK